MLSGNSPILIDKKSSKIHILGTAYSVDYYIKEYVSTYL